MKELQISKEISLPIKAVTETFSAIGRRGAGKSYLATMIAEQMLDAKAQVIAIDPVGIWWGLRVGADGRSKGKEIFVIGGEHGDVPIVPEAGRRIAQLVVEKNISAVIDVSGFRLGEHKRFAADFAEEFFHLKKTRKSPVHVFIEEAQTLIPQRVGADEARMVGAFERIVRLGRNYGIGCTLVTQRPQSVNKEVLSQVECLFVLQITGLHERKALEGWVQEKDADRKLVGELPSLSRGEGYVWSPSFLRLYQRVHFSKKKTFDASATPEVGKETKAASISAVDVEKLKKDMADVVEKAEQDNPAALRRKIQELKRAKPQVDSKDIDKSIAQAVLKKEREFAVEKRELERQIAERDKKLSQISKILGQEISPKPLITKPHFRTIEPLVNRNIQVTNLAPSEFESEIKITGGALRMLKVLASRYPTKLTKSQLATFSKLKSSSGTYGTYLSLLRGQGLIEDDGELFMATEKGIEYCGESPDAPQTPEEVIEMWRNNINGGARRMFDILVEIQPDSTTKEELAIQANLEPTSGTFGTYLSILSSNGLIERKGDMIRLNPDLLEV